MSRDSFPGFVHMESELPDCFYLRLICASATLCTLPDVSSCGPRHLLCPDSAARNLYPARTVTASAFLKIRAVPHLALAIYYLVFIFHEDVSRTVGLLLNRGFIQMMNSS